MRLPLPQQRCQRSSRNMDIATRFTVTRDPLLLINIIKELTELCEMKHTRCLPYTPQGNAT